MCTDLRQHYKIPNELTLLTARKSYNLVPKDGDLPNGASFSFHGIGCYFEFENGAIDVDFGPNDKCDGFDFYRLKDFLLRTRKSSFQL
jgi:hypothetical protein